MIIRQSLTLLILSASVFASPPGIVEAAEFRSGVEVLIGSDEVLDEDVYIIANRVIVDGTINGDLLAAGQSIAINGAVNGDLIVAGRTLAISGNVEDDVRAAGAELQFSSSIGEDLIAAGYQIEIKSNAVIGEDLVAGSDTLIVSGDVKGSLDLNVREATIEGAVGGDVQAIVEEQLILSPQSRIDGTLNYTSESDVTMQQGAVVLGQVTQQPPEIEIFGSTFPISTIILAFSKIIEQAKWFIGTLLVGLALIWLFPDTLQNLIETLSNSPLKSLGVGVLVFPLLPLLFLILMIAALSSVGFSAFPVVAVPAMAYAALLLLAKPVIAICIGDYIARRRDRQDGYLPSKALAVGAAILAGLGLIPYVDSIVGWLTLILGFGMWLLYLFRSYSEARAVRLA